MSFYVYCGPVPFQTLDDQLREIYADDCHGETRTHERFIDTKDQRDVPWLQRPQARALLERVASGDTIIVATLQAVFTGCRDLVPALDVLAGRGVSLVALAQMFTYIP